jgi:tetratricopeptide (TPR) repeat protein
MNQPSQPEQLIQSILDKAQVGGDLTVGDIQQIVNIYNQSHSGSGDNVAGNKIVNNKYYLNIIEKYQPKNTPHNIPSSNTIQFVGRAETLVELDHKLKESGHLAITAVKGMGGIGKTELAIQYALVHFLLKSYQGGICWLNAREENIGLQVIRFAQTHLDLKPLEEWDLPQQVEFCWSRWQDKKEGNVLVVLDDVTDYAEIEPYLPPQPSLFKVLVTTRLDLDDIPSLALDVLTEEEAIELLKQWVGEDEIDKQIDDTKELCGRLGNLPLALNLVGRYIKKRQISIAEMLSRLENKGLSHQALQVDKKDKKFGLKIKRGVAAAFELSWAELIEEAQKLGCLLSIFALAPIQWELVEQVKIDLDTEEKEDGRIELESLHLIQSQENSYRLHQLIREFFQDKLEKLAEKDKFKRFYVESILVIARKVHYTLTINDIGQFEPIIPHITAVADNLTQYLRDENQEIIGIFTSLSWFYQGQGLYNLALSWSEKCVNFVSERLEVEHPDVASSLNNLALLYYTQGKYEQAETLFLQALDLYQKLLGAEHPELATSFVNLATLYYGQGKYEQAEPLYLQALDLYQKLLGAEHPNVATSVNNLALLYYAQGKYEQAEPLYLQALDLYQKLLGAEHPNVATSVNNLALLYYAQGKYEQAEPLYLQALDLYQKLLGAEHPNVATPVNNLALLYESQGKYEQAEPMYLQCLRICYQTLGENHPNTITGFNNFVYFLKQVIEANRVDELSNDPYTQSLLKQIQSEQD